MASKIYNGTNGYYVFKYNEKYYTFLNIYDSYPDWLGKKIVNEISMFDDSDYKKIKDQLDRIKSTKYNFRETRDFVSLKETLEHPLSYTFWILDFEPVVDMFIDYIYILDLDKEYFKVSHFSIVTGLDSVKYKLREIPSDWDSILE